MGVNGNPKGNMDGNCKHKEVKFAKEDVGSRGRSGA